jgi:Trk-type K+ transport system membrane component
MLARLSPARIIILGFAAMILVGTLLLKLPASSYGISWLDAFFEATSAVTVTGLQVVTPATGKSAPIPGSPEPVLARQHEVMPHVESWSWEAWSSTV